MDNIPRLTTEQMIEVDRAMIEDFHIELIQMMENAGRNLAHLARERFLDKNPIGKNVVVLAGTGGNGGGAMVCARRLHAWGANMFVCLTKPPASFSGIPFHQLDILQRMKVPLEPWGDSHPPKAIDLVVDGLIGYSLSGPPREPIASMIRWANETEQPILSLDAPSGIDTTTGNVHNPSIKATATMTLALPKEGLLSKDAKDRVGELYLADIGVPPSLYKAPSIGLSVGNIFAVNDILRLR